MIPEYTTLYPTSMDGCRMYYHGEPFGYWLHEAGEWVLYKEYNSYQSVCAPDDCLRAVSREDLMKEFREYSWFKDEEREKLCRTFRQRAIDTNEYEVDDFVYDMDRQEILDILKQGANFELGEDGHGYGAINRCPECKDMNQYDYSHSHYPKKKALLESLPWNVVERPRNPMACEYPTEDGEYIVMLDCDEHAVLNNSFKNGKWTLYHETHVKWWLKLPEA